jgi:uncharacterized protein (DUF433 family)
MFTQIGGREMDRLIRYGSAVNHVDRREIPAYTPTEVAYYLGIRQSTLRSWIYGRYYHTTEGRKFYPPLIIPADGDNGFLSFYNLAECHVLAATRYKHDVPVSAIRDAIEHLRKQYPSEHPLISRDFFTDGRDVFVKELEQTVNLSKQGQLGLKPVLDMYLERIVVDKQFRPKKLFPLIPGQEQEKVVSIVSGVSSGRPVIDGTGVPVAVVWDRHKAGEDVETLAEDYEIPIPKIKRAIEYVEHLKAA